MFKTTNSVKLLQNCSFQLNSESNTEYQKLTSRNLSLRRSPDPQGSSEYFNQLLVYIENHFSINNSKILSLKFNDANQERASFTVQILADFLKFICINLQNPFLQIQGTVLDLEGRVAPISMEPKDYKLQDWLGAPNLVSIGGPVYQVSQICLPTRNYQRRCWTCEVSVCWFESFQKTLKMNPSSIIQKLFENESGKDLTVVAGDGTEVKCHQFIFTAHSPVLAAMLSFGSGMMESQTGRIELKENSEEGITHFIRYLYGMEIIANEIKSELALELFQTAHKYQLPCLEKGLQELFLNHGEDWFTMDTVFELYYYVRNMKGHEKLRDRCLTLLKCTDTDRLRSCEGFQKLDPVEGADLLFKLLGMYQKEIRKTN